MSPKSRVVVTVDGLAGSGKTSISMRLAEKLNFVHLSTGLVYRAVGWLALGSKVDPDDEQQVVNIVSKHKIELRIVKDAEGSRTGTVFIDGVDRKSVLYSPEVSEATSKCSRHKLVREALFDIQREAFPGENLVAEGRDMGTIVFPDALVKFFVDVKPEIRVQRRIQQMYGDTKNFSGAELSKVKAQMLKEVTERDARDSGRKVAPTKAAEDGVVIDNSAGTLEEVVGKMVNIVGAKRE